MSTELKSKELLVKASKEDTLLFYAKCQSYVRKKSKNQEVVEDFPSWALDKFLTKGITRVDLLLIDYLRAHFGYIGSSKNEALHSMSGVEDWMELGQLSGTAEGSLLFSEILSLVDEREKKLLSLYFTEGLTLKEISLEMSLTEARLSQMLKGVLEKLKDLL